MKAIKYEFTEELLKYCNLNNKITYHTIFIINKLEDLLEKKYNKYVLDDKIKNQYIKIFNINYCPNSISKTMLINFVKKNRKETFDVSILKLNVFDNGKKIDTILI